MIVSFFHSLQRLAPKLLDRSVGINSLSGQVPKELGKLTDLRSLSLATNNFSGTLPLDLGNLTQLEQLYITSSRVRGTIPSTFSSLKNLQTFQELFDPSFLLSEKIK